MQKRTDGEEKGEEEVNYSEEAVMEKIRERRK